MLHCSIYLQSAFCGSAIWPNEINSAALGRLPLVATGGKSCGFFYWRTLIFNPVLCHVKNNRNIEDALCLCLVTDCMSWSVCNGRLNHTAAWPVESCRSPSLPLPSSGWPFTLSAPCTWRISRWMHTPVLWNLEVVSHSRRSQQNRVQCEIALQKQ